MSRALSTASGGFPGRPSCSARRATSGWDSSQKLITPSTCLNSCSKTHLIPRLRQEQGGPGCWQDSTTWDEKLSCFVAARQKTVPRLLPRIGTSLGHPCEIWIQDPMLPRNKFVFDSSTQSLPLMCRLGELLDCRLLSVIELR